MSGVVLVAGGSAWACVPGHDHTGSGTGGTGNTSASPAAGTPAAPAAPGPEAATPASSGPVAGTPALPMPPAAAAPPVTAGMYNPTSASSSSSDSGGQKVLGVGLFAAGGLLVLGGVRSVVRSRRPRRPLTPVNL